jgi:hypothetical protein
VILRAQAGFWPHEKVKVRAQYHHTELVSGAGGTLSDEFNLIGEWYPTSRWWVNLMAGYSVPGDALARSGLVNTFSFFNTGAVPVGTKASVDVVLAVGFNF